MGLIGDTRRELRDAPKGVFNFYLFFCTWVFGLAGIARGYDEANIASIVVQQRFKETFHLAQLSEEAYANTKGWIVAIATAGAAIGCIVFSPMNDYVGRRWTLRAGTLAYMAGILGMGLNRHSLAGLYASRFIAGMGMGVATVVPPVYIAEIAPKAVRGVLILQYAVFEQLGVVLGFFINYGVTKAYAGTDTQWMLPMLLQLAPAALWGLGTFAARVLSRLRHLPVSHRVVTDELAGMNAQLVDEAKATANSSQWERLKETLVIVENRRRFFLVMLCNIFAQWSGSNAITQYSPTIFGYMGISGDNGVLLATGVYGVVKLGSTIVFSVAVVDFLGRRRSLMAGISLQLATLVYVGAYLGATDDMTTTAISNTPSASRASTAAIVSIYLHAVGWSMGWFPVPYLIGSEIFPTRIRAMNMSLSMAVHWASFFGCSRAMPSLLEATDRWGAFAFFGSICFLSLIYVFLAMPEATGRSLEASDGLFQRPWYTMFQVSYAQAEPLQGVHPEADAESTTKDPPRNYHAEKTDSLQGLPPGQV